MVNKDKKKRFRPHQKMDRTGNEVCHQNDCQVGIQLTGLIDGLEVNAPEER